MKIKSVFSKAFAKYGKVLTGYDVSDLLKKLDDTTKKPDNAVIYEPGDAGLESLPIAKELSDNAYGGMPIQIGYCNGYNTKLNCLEWHRGSELNIPSNDMVLLLAPLQSVKKGKLDTNLVEAFYVPKGTVVQVYETTLHYAPCNAVKNGEVSKEGFRVIIVLPKDTNTEKPAIKEVDFEDKLLWARNKWLIAHPDSNEAKQGAFVGLFGKNIDIYKK
ncbi:DUF4867 family protein [Treponema ruminis]|uniref:DUF4867 domain-containing protein n=1 Tax=Treponema ruminis TaxID=744515 RepID=A0A7W8LMF7_9SPIR|nr:DUF4867 family protein [Treponema ruminis]MBB5226338.1 hypothetical protein [Treponema ruminis]QSI02757.1 DUF4867 family protein [Treponema ruminis]